MGDSDFKLSHHIFTNFKSSIKEDLTNSLGKKMELLLFQNTTVRVILGCNISTFHQLLHALMKPTIYSSLFLCYLEQSDI